MGRAHLLLPLKAGLVAAGLLAGLSACAGGSGTVPPPPAALRLDPFYAKYLDAGGIPVIGSRRAPDEALRKAQRIVLDMLARRADVRAELVRQGVRVAVMAPDEATTDLPEQRHWKKPTKDDPRLTACELKHFDRIDAMSDRDYWNARARGTGGTFTTVGAENLLASPSGRYFGENILVHEFSHAILGAIERADPALFAALIRAYEAARAAGKWTGDYASVSAQEYWAEGTQFWFNTNMLARLDDAQLLSAQDLQRYDPALAAVLERAFGPRHRLLADAFYNHPARLNVPIGYKSADC
ncbi:MAG TPA: glycoside hydrolase [Allosphingosinicella sp.]